MTDKHQQQVSIIGSSYFQPIANLLEKLLCFPKPIANEVQAGSQENGYCASIILLLVSALESYVMRVRYINKNGCPIERIPVTEYLQKLYPDYKNAKQLKESFIVRDVLIHNHLWEIDFSWNEEWDMTFLQAKKELSAGDKKYKEEVDDNKKITRTLQLNIIPTKVGRTDLLKIFDVVWETLLFLENKNRNQCYVSHLYCKFNGEHVLFGKLREALRISL